MIRAIMATYPARKEIVPRVVESIARQVDLLHIVCNEFSDVPDSWQLPDNVRIEFPVEDIKDAGKFFCPAEPDDFVVLCDDDILYPPNYVGTLIERWYSYESYNPVIGVHGVTYSDFFDGDPQARLVYVFNAPLSADTFVNQLGTGTVLCRGYQMPSFRFMQGSERYVDLRFAVHCHNKNYARICIARKKDWMQEIRLGESIFETFTKSWSPDIVREVQPIAGFRHLPKATLLPQGSQT